MARGTEMLRPIALIAQRVVTAVLAVLLCVSALSPAPSWAQAYPTKPVRMILPYLGGASTLAEYRGRGAFRALVRTRWDEAVAQGVPILLVQAGKMSVPIFRRLGFESTGEITMLRDRSSR